MILEADRREYRRLFRLAFPDHVRSLERADSKRHPDRNHKKYLARRANHLEEVRAFDRERYASRLASGYFRRAGRKHYLNHKASYLERWARRNAIKIGATVGSKSALDKVYARASHLRRWFDVTVDHIVPLGRGGKHTSTNLQIIYRRENSSKGMRMDYKPTVIFK